MPNDGTFKYGNLAQVPQQQPRQGDENGGVAPYAVLHLRIDRAHGLPAADFTGVWALGSGLPLIYIYIHLTCAEL